MLGAFDTLDDLGDIIQVDAGPHRAKVACPNLERFGCFDHLAAGESRTDGFVHNGLKGLAGPPCLGAEFLRHIILKCQGGTHHLDGTI